MKKISESVWGDVLDRGTGETIRKEDDINLLDVDGLYDYIKSKYEKRIFYLDKYTGKFNLWEICVDIIGNISLKTIYNEDGEIDHIVLSWSGVGVKIRHSFLWALSEKFNVENVGTCRRVIKEKDGTCTNQTYIDIIEFFLNNKDNMLVNESAWSGMLDRGRGDDKRKEDKISENLLNALSAYIEIFASIEYTHDYTVGSYSEFKAFIKDFKDKPRVSSLDYDMEDLLNYTKEHWDDTVLPAIEDAVNNVNATVDDIIDSLKDQNVNESTWGGMLDRGAGETVRKEDELTDEEMETLKQYISQYAYEIVYGEGRGTEACKLDEFCDFLENNMESDPKIIDYVKTFWFDEICDLVNDAIEDRQNDPQEEYVNESTWGGILDRGAGETVRKEDDLTPNDMKYSFIGFAERIVYYEQYKNTFDDFEKFMKERWNIFTDDGKEYVQKQVDYTRRNWDKGKVFKKTVDEDINRIEENIKKLGFEKEPGKTIDGTLDDWWDSLESYEKQDVLTARGAEDNYVHPDEMWGDLDWTEKMTEYVECNKETNESTWGGMLDRGTGETVRKEDEVLNDDDFLMLRETAKMFKNVLNRSANEPWSGTCDDFIKYINLRKKEHFWNDISDEVYDKVIKFVKDNWGDCTGIQEFIDKYLSNINESVWKGILDRGRGDTVKKEDELSDDEYDTIEKLLADYATRVVWGRYSDEFDSFYDYVENDESGIIGKHTSVDFLLNYIKDNWTDKLSGRLSGYIKMKEEERQKNITNECEGVPGGATPASVGGMGAAYFPGPDGTPGSGDPPSPTGIVYHQVAPYTMFLKQIKKKKKKSKKFRKEDEPCVHSPNAKVYDYVDDFREYVDRTYNQMDRR